MIFTYNSDAVRNQIYMLHFHFAHATDQQGHGSEGSTSKSYFLKPIMGTPNRGV